MSIVLPFKLYSKAYLLFFQFHIKTLKQCTYQFKIKYKHQSIIVYQPCWLSKVLYRLIPNFERKNIFEHTDGIWAIISLKNIPLECSDSVKRMHLN
jgi:hypothetical protein